jgi:hypothetical protein
MNCRSGRVLKRDLSSEGGSRGGGREQFVGFAGRDGGDSQFLRGK